VSVASTRISTITPSWVDASARTVPSRAVATSTQLREGGPVTEAIAATRRRKLATPQNRGLQTEGSTESPSQTRNVLRSHGRERLEMDDDQTQHLRVLIANERRERLELLAQVVAGLGTR